MNSNYYKILTLCITVLFISQTMNGQKYFQQKVAFDIEASLDSNHVVDGVTTITYTHNGQQELDTFFLHLWMNAFTDRLSAYSEQSIRTGDLDFYFAKQKYLGGYRDISVYVNDQKVNLYAYQEHKDVTYFLPSRSIKPNETITIECRYNLQLPKKFSRAGYTNKDVYLTYWYPTPAVYDTEGWHPMPYLSMGETFTEIADYQVNFTSPYDQVLGSVLPTKEAFHSLSFTGNDLNDFAIVCSQEKHIFNDKYNDKLDISVMSADTIRAQNTIKYFKSALPYFEQHIGPFPFSSLAIIDKGASAKSGMEYPGLITISGADDESGNMEYYIVHELLHQYFYAALATDQRTRAWMDEGMTTYYQQRYYRDTYDSDHYSKNIPFVNKNNSQPFLQTVARGQAKRHYGCPLHTDAEEVDPINYGLNAYEIPARMFQYLEAYMGDSFDRGMQQYFSQWQKKHPSPHDFQQIMEQEYGDSLSWFFDDLITSDWSYDYKIDDLKNGMLHISHLHGSSPPYPVTLADSEGNEKQIWIDGHSGQIEVPVDKKWMSAIIDADAISMDVNRDNNTINIKRPLKIVPFAQIDAEEINEVFTLPFFSYNTSDGGLLGAVFYNSTFPTKNFKWLVNPSYALGSGKVVGEAWTSYDQYIEHPWIRKFKYGLNAKRYSFRYSESLDATLSYFRINPTFSLHFKNDDYSSKYRKIYFKPIFINEEVFQFNDTEVSIGNASSTIFRLGYEYYNFWSLAPSELNVQLEYQPYENAVNEKHHYTKLTASYKKSFKYASERSVDFRLWGSYFITNSQRNSANYDGAITRGSSALIYQGFNDYAYDDYFFNRDNQGVRLDNQVSFAGGGFKTPLGSQYSIGQTNDFAFSVNIETDFPIKLPKFLPLRLFVDAGYYTTKLTEEQDLQGRSLISGGLMLSYGEGLFNIYLPVFNSSEISELYEVEGISNLGKVSFRIDLHRFNPWDLLEDFVF